MKLLVTGAGGLLGHGLREVVGPDHRLVALTHADLDVTDADAVRAALVRHRPAAVLHCAAWTAVDDAERHPDQARTVNVDGATHVARAAAAVGAVAVYVSTDFVFDGQARSPYPPDHPPAPLGVYGRTKLEGERRTREEAPEHLVVRTGGVYGGGGGNFVDAILRRARAGRPLRVVDDQVVAPTWSQNLARALLELVEDGARGVWHVQDAGATTWHAFAVRALREAGIDAAPEAVSSAEYGAAAPRPAYSVLDTSATEARLGRPMMPHATALATYLRVSGPPVLT